MALINGLPLKTDRVWAPGEKWSRHRSLTGGGEEGLNNGLDMGA